MRGMTGSAGRAATTFRAPFAAGADVTVTDVTVMVRASPQKMRGARNALVATGLLFVLLPLAALATQGARALPGLLLALAGVGLLYVALAPGKPVWVDVTRDGVRSTLARPRARGGGFFPAKDARAVRLVRVTRPDPHSGNPRGLAEWRVGVALASGEVVGVVVEADEARARRIAEAVRRILRVPLDAEAPAPAAPPASGAGAPDGWPMHPRIRVEETPREVVLAVAGARWGWLARTGILLALLTVAGVGFLGAMVWLAWRGMPDADVAARVVVLAFAAIPAWMVWRGARGVAWAWRTFGPGESVNVVAPDAVTATGTREGAVMVPTADVRRVVAADGNVVLHTDAGEMALAFHRLERPEDVAWARDAVEYALRSRATSQRR